MVYWLVCVKDQSKRSNRADCIDDVKLIRHILGVLLTWPYVCIFLWVALSLRCNFLICSKVLYYFYYQFYHQSCYNCTISVNNYCIVLFSPCLALQVLNKLLFGNITTCCSCDFPANKMSTASALNIYPLQTRAPCIVSALIGCNSFWI